MAVEDIGNLIPTKIPAYVDDADIQAALKAYHYGSYDFDVNETDPDNLLDPSMAKTIYELQTDILAVDAKTFATVDATVPVPGDFPANEIPDAYIWLDSNAPTADGPYSATAVYADSAPTTNLANGLIWVDKNTDPIEMYAYNAGTSSWDEINRGPSGIVNVSDPIVNTGTNSSAELELSLGSGLTISSGDLAIDTEVTMPVDYIRSWSGQSTDAIDIIPRWTINGTSTISNDTIYLYYFTPMFNFTVSNISMASSVAQEDATFARMGIYSVDGMLGLTLVARTANNASLFDTADTVYTEALSTTGGFPSTYNLVAGQRYAAALVMRNQSTHATTISSGSSSYQNVINLSPKILGALSGETDLIGTISNLQAAPVNTGISWVRFT